MQKHVITSFRVTFQNDTLFALKSELIKGMAQQFLSFVILPIFNIFNQVLQFMLNVIACNPCPKRSYHSCESELRSQLSVKATLP